MTCNYAFDGIDNAKEIFKRFPEYPYPSSNESQLSKIDYFIHFDRLLNKCSKDDFNTLYRWHKLGDYLNVSEKLKQVFDHLPESDQVSLKTIFTKPSGDQAFFDEQLYLQAWQALFRSMQ